MKYIIEFEDEPYMREDGVDYYTCKSACWYKLGDTIINRLEPYIESNRKAIEDEVWEFVKKIECLTIGETEDCFDVEYEGIPFVANMFSFQEAKDKYEKWLKQKEEIHVGDEVVVHGLRVVVMKLDEKGNVDRYFTSDGKTFGNITGFLNNEVKKTGRHFPEVAELLEKMRGES